jgi:hypothetical protein
MHMIMDSNKHALTKFSTFTCKDVNIIWNYISLSSCHFQVLVASNGVEQGTNL